MGPEALCFRVARPSVCVYGIEAFPTGLPSTSIVYFCIFFDIFNFVLVLCVFLQTFRSLPL